MEGEKKNCGNWFVQWNCRNGRKNKLCQLICGNVVVKMEGKKMWQLIVFFGIAEMGGNKKRIMAMELPKIGGERERENCLDKIFIYIYIYIYLEESITSSLPSDSYSPKYLEYILYSFPIKPNLLISHIESMLWILFCLFIYLFVIKGRHHH